MKIQDLTDKQADKWCALAQGWIVEDGTIGIPHQVSAAGDVDFELMPVSEYTPTTNPAQWGELIGEFTINISHLLSGGIRVQSMNPLGSSSFDAPKEDIGRAVVNAVIASVYGDSVPEEE